MTLKRFITLTVSVLALFPLYKLVQACAGEAEPYDEYPAFFSNEVNNKPVYTPFYYQSWLKYYDDWYDAPKRELTDPNTKAWREYTGNPVTEPDLDSFIYAYKYTDLKSLYFNIEKGEPLNIGKDVAANGMTKWFNTSKDLEALGYLMYAKQCEPLVNVNDEWATPERDTAKMNKMLRNGLQLQKAAKKDFIRDRYNFQVIRLAFYSRNPAKALELYNTLIGDKTGNDEIYARTLSLKGGALFRLKRNAEAAYCFAQVFDKSDYMKSTAYQSFDWSVGHNVTAVLKLCKTPHERAVVQVMNGLHNYEYGLPDMQAAYEADPQVAGLDVIMTREINKQEERYQSKMLDRERNVSPTAGWGYGQYNYWGERSAEEQEKEKAETEKSKRYLGLLNSFAQRMISEGKRTDKAFWRLSASYLYFMVGDMDNSQKLMDAAKTGTLNNKERDLTDVLNVIYTIRSNKQVNASIESKLLPLLKSMKKRADQKAFKDAMTTILTTAYLKQGDTVKAVYAMAKGFGYVDMSYTDMPGSLLERVSIQKLQDARTFLERNNKTDYERWLTDSIGYSVAGLNDLEGTKYIRQYDFEKAVAVLSKSKDSADLPDPFIAHVSDVYELTDIDVKSLASKLSYSKRMLALQQKIKASPNDADALFQYATGLYSITYYGKTTYACTYYRSSSDGLAYFNNTSRKTSPAYVQEYYGAITAEKMFVKAAESTTNPELKAKALFMAAKCWQKRCEGGKAFSYYDDDMLKLYYRNSLNNPYFKQLKSGSSATKLYQEALSTCDYFKDYAAKNK